MIKLDFTGLKALGEIDEIEDASEPAQPAPDLFEQCWEMLETYYSMDYESEPDWEAIMDLSERIYQTEKARAGGRLTDQESKAITAPIQDTMNYIEKISKHRRDYTYTYTHT